MKFRITQIDDNRFVAEVYTGFSLIKAMLNIGPYDTIQWCRTYEQAIEVCKEYKETYIAKKERAKKYPIKNYIDL